MFDPFCSMGQKSLSLSGHAYFDRIISLKKVIKYWKLTNLFCIYIQFLYILWKHGPSLKEQTSVFYLLRIYGEPEDKQLQCLTDLIFVVHIYVPKHFFNNKNTIIIVYITFYEIFKK